jgi:hypothetical protein
MYLDEEYCYCCGYYHAEPVSVTSQPAEGCSCYREDDDDYINKAPAQVAA